MSGYSCFAKYYDRLQKVVGLPYDEIADLIDRFIKKYSSENEVIVDLACGTGNLSERLAKKGYDVIGVDSSEEMLDVAQKKKEQSGLDITYVCQDMAKLDLWGAADVIVCMLDSLNHIESAQELEKTFERVSMFVCDGGLFIFDLNTIWKQEKILGNNCFVYELEDLMCVWQNELGEDFEVTVTLDFFDKQPDGRYERSTESFIERGMAFLEAPKLAEKYGFEIVGEFAGFTDEEYSHSSAVRPQRVLYVCKRKKGLIGKLMQKDKMKD